jgi:uncharacterized lipoprotein NlpE involved in copper resistance
MKSDIRATYGPRICNIRAIRFLLMLVLASLLMPASVWAAPTLKCNSENPSSAVFDVDEGECSTTLGTVLTQIPTGNKPSLINGTVLRNEYWYCTGETTSGQILKRADVNTQLEAGVSYTIQTRIYYAADKYYPCDQVVTVKDAQNPVCPDTPIALTVAGSCEYSKSDLLDALKLLHYGSDNCALNGVEYVGGKNSYTFENTHQSYEDWDGTTYYTGNPQPINYRLTDIHGNVSTCQSTVLVNLFSCPVDTPLIKLVSKEGVKDEDVENIINKSISAGESTYLNEGCFGEKESGEQLNSNVTAANLDLESLTPCAAQSFSYIVTGKSEHWISVGSYTCPAKVVLTENHPPVCAKNDTVTMYVTAEKCQFTGVEVLLTKDPSYFGTDDCGLVTVKEQYGQTFTPSDSKNGKQLNYILSDVQGNQSYCSAVVIVEDKMPPSCPETAPVIKMTAYDQKCQYYTSECINILHGLDYGSDACQLAYYDDVITPIGNESYSYASTHANGQVGADLVYILKNKAGLTRQCIAKVVVNDNVKPVCNIDEKQITLHTDECGTAMTKAQLLDSVKAMGAANGWWSDNCTDVKDIKVQSSESIHSNYKPRLNPYYFSLTLQDAAGNVNVRYWSKGCSVWVTIAKGPLACPSNPPVLSLDATSTQCSFSASEVIAKIKANASYGTQACGLDQTDGVTVLSTADYSYASTHANGATTSDFLYQLKDKAGTTAQCTAKVVVNDAVKPVMDCSTLTKQTLKLTTADCRLKATDAALVVPVAKDNCDGDIKGTQIPDPISYDLGDTTITWHFVDKAGNETTCNQNITVNNDYVPECPKTLNTAVKIDYAEASCLSTELINSHLGNAPTVVYNCKTLTGVLTAPISYKMGDNTIYYTFKYAANTMQCKQTVTIVDKHAPDCSKVTLADMTVAADEDVCSASADRVMLSLNNQKPTITDNCETIKGVLPARTAAFASGTTAVTWTFTDAAGNYCTKTQNVIVEDQTSPKCPATAPALTLLSTADKCEFSSADVLATLKEGANCGSDNCGLATQDGVSAVSAGSYSYASTHPTVSDFIYQLKDKSGNKVQCTAKVVVNDAVAPTCNILEESITLHADECETPLTQEQVLDSVRTIGLANGWWSDNCTDAKDVSVQFAGSTSAAYNAGAYYLLPLSLTDASGNTTKGTTYYDGGTCALKVEIAVKESLACPANPSVLSLAAAYNRCSFSALEVFTKLKADARYGMTDCRLAKSQGAKSVSTGYYSYASTHANGATSSDFIYQLKDKAGNKVQCTAKVVVNDAVKPVMDCSTLTKQTLKLTTADCRLKASDAALAVPVSKDNCDGDIKGTQIPAPASYALGDTTITWHFVDKAGNETTCDQKIEVEDGHAPVIDCNTIQPITAKITNNACRIALNITAPKAKDNCDKDIVGTAILPSTFGLGDTTITWKFVDAATNSSQCTQQITVSDKSIPVIDCNTIQPITAEITNNACRVALNITAPKAKDNCDKDIKGTAVLPSTFGLGDTTITWKFTDAATNSTQCTQQIKVSDKSAPVIDCNTIQPITAEITDNSCRIALNITAPKAKDNCDKDIVGTAVLPSTFGLGDTTITWKFADKAGNAMTCTQSIKVEDKSVPVIDCNTIQPITAEITNNACRIALTLTAPKAKDNCDKDITGIANLPSTFGLGDTTITWKFVDAATNSSQCTQQITVSDKSVPVIDCSKINPITAKITDNACRIALSLTAPTAKDNCGKDIVGTANLPSTFGLGDTTIIWNFADAATNSSQCTQHIIVSDKSAPVIDCNTIKPITAEISDNSCRIALSLTAPKAKDNCDKDITGTAVLPSTFGLGDTTITWKFADGAGNATTCTQDIKVEDKSVPVIKCSDIQPITAKITNNACRIALNITAPTAKDNCDKDITGIAVLPSTFGLGDTTITWKFVDNAGNATICTQDIKVEDKSVPVIDCSKINPITAEITDNACRIALNITVPTAKDNCDKDITGTAVLPSTFGLGDTTITWKFTDGATNSTQCTQKIAVSDKSAPVIDCNTIQPITAEITNNACRIALNITAPKAKDNCDKDIIGTAVLPSTFGLGDTTITWKFADKAGNAMTCTQNINVEDKSAPVIKCSDIKPITAEITNNACRIALTITAPKAKDNCDKDITGTAVLPSTFGLGDTTITWKFADKAGNATTCTQSINVKDKSVPVIDCKTIQPITAEITDNSCRIALTITAPKAKDNCDKDITGIAVLPSTFGLGDTTITWKFVDAATNSSQCTQQITVSDKSVPVIDCSKINPITAKITDNACRIALSLTAPTAKDNCDKDITGTANLPSTFGLGDTTITWKFADKAGNATTCTQSIKVEDRSVPVIDCNTIKPITAEISDNSCRIALSLTAPKAKDNCDKDITGAAVLPSTFGLGDTTITWKFVDAATNSSQCTQHIIVSDKSAPVIDCSKINPITAEITNNSCRIALNITAPKAKDNCDKDITGIAVLPSTFGLGDTTITWKFVDAATNSTQCTQQITVLDKSIPVIDCSKINPITAEITNNSCRIALNITAPKAKDNCDKDITGTAVLPSTFGLGDTTITWQFVDAATNSTQCTQQITVSDKSVPVIDCNTIQPITAKITDNACRIALNITAPKAKDNCDKDITGTAVLPSTFGLGDTTITWQFVDAATNSTQCTQQITVSDKSVPVIDCNTIQPITAKITDNACRIALTITAPTAKDNCDKDIVGTANLPSAFGLGDTTITWKFVDAATNSTQCTQQITVSDKSAPIIDCSDIKPVTAEITDNACRIALNITAPKAKDNCDKDIMGTANLPSTYGLGDTTITWKFVDAATNSTQCTQQITVLDKSIPVIDCSKINPITAEITNNSCRIALTITAPKAKDNCDKDITGTANLPSTFGLGDTTITWKFADGAGNATTCTQSVKVEDKSVPVIDCNTIQPITAKITDNACRIALSLTAPKAKDNCDKDIAGTAILPSTFGLGDTTITWKFVDAATNSSQCTQQITVSDKSAPVIDCSKINPITAEISDNSCRIALSLTAPKAKDNCDKDIVGTAILPSTFGLGDTTITWKFADGAGNATTCTQSIKVEDRSVPVIDCNTIKPITAEISDNSCRIALSLTAPKAKDNCDKDITGTAVLPSTFGLGDTTITWKFVDGAGNATTCTQSVKVEDKSVPVIDCNTIQPITAKITDNACRIALSLTAPKAKDNCDKDIVGTAVLPSTFGLGDTTITWKFADGAGNATTCTQSITVSDKSAPVIDCNTIQPITAEITDNSWPHRIDPYCTES